MDFRSIKRSVDRCCKLFTLLSVWMFLGACHSAGMTSTRNRSTGIRIQGPGVQPHLGFACLRPGDRPWDRPPLPFARFVKNRRGSCGAVFSSASEFSSAQSASSRSRPAVPVTWSWPRALQRTSRSRMPGSGLGRRGASLARAATRRSFASARPAAGTSRRRERV
jgi:hypothetical protein